MWGLEPNFSKNIKKVIILIATIILSSLSITLLDNEPTFHYYHLIGFLGSGVFFSIFLLLISEVKRSIFSTISTYLLLVALWLASFYSSMLTWGGLSPIFGAISAWIISRYVIFECIEPKEITNYFLLGGISSLAGLVLFYILPIPPELFGTKMIGIITFWQISIGVKTLKMQMNK